MDIIPKFFLRQFNLFRDNLLNPKLDHYAFYVFFFGSVLLVLFLLCLILKKEKFILPSLLLGLLLTPGLFYLRELSPWSRYFKPPAPTQAPAEAIPKLGEVQVDESKVVVPPQPVEPPRPVVTPVSP